jgi:hypothetical protein
MKTAPGARNPFGVEDAPDPDGSDVREFAADARLDGAATDPNARAWNHVREGERRDTIAGEWSSRWNGGVDGTIAGDTQQAWKQGKAELKIEGDRVYLLFDWADGTRRALIEARLQAGNRLRGRYVNLSDRTITRPWAGLIVDNQRIDGVWTHGHLDFRR